MTDIIDINASRKWKRVCVVVDVREKGSYVAVLYINGVALEI